MTMVPIAPITRRAALAAITFTTMLAWGCDRDRAQNGPEVVVDVDPGYGAAVAPAVERIAAARCDLETRCEKVGAGRDYADRSACTAKIASDYRPEMTAWRCRGGINQKELAECIEEIRNSDCGAPFDTLERVIACRPSDLCDTYAP